MGKKTKSQLKRLIQRAAARGETYQVPSDHNESKEKKENETDPEDIKTRIEAATEIQQELNKLENAPEMKAKDRRTAKRKIEAIAKEATDGALSASELLEWYQVHHAKETVSSKSVAAEADKMKSTNDSERIKAAIDIQHELKHLEENDSDLKAKDRRTAKRKMEAIAKEVTAGELSAMELVEWYQKHQQQQQQINNGKMQKEKSINGSKENTTKKKKNPYIVFVGQLSYETTKEDLFQHFQKEMAKEYPHISHETISIRLLTDPQTKKSRGMAFVEVKDDPELLYACLKLHHTQLQGRRINVERTTGGGSKTTRHEKLQQLRKEQEEHISNTIDSMIADYKKRGELQENELDSGVIELCKRHSTHVVQAAIDKYIESNGRTMDNPSAYFTFLLGKLATEGIFETFGSGGKSKGDNAQRGASSKKGVKRGSGEEKDRSLKRQK